ncbi:PDZ domain-containing protein [Halanaerobium saccharolyticum]|uniref:PDZ domain-containing protein n=1 Tax=Halanaerobium saccharolyticum TaxID=43595 RepID=A0A4R7YU67_9FIRM|nr:PDZ domain-containing protein [Halanaerobium saccharolyticum]RAK06211.1 PDZ domain-containing protein [Halanaerobium saccharolyticum]TDW00576.1 PDZ domain-containing protein [Halanaerobium saccharolyticum]TDX52241.1 PDZ domain-containing protein [Halanaerobium saccharolyticum]
MINKRFKKLYSRLIGIIFVLFVISHFLPVPYQVMAPGIAAELSPMIEVENGYENQGEFLLTAVSSRRAVAWDYFYISFFAPEDRELTAISEQLPENMEMNEYIELMAELMEESKLQAQAVAFRQAGYEVEVSGEGAEVVEVMEEGSAYNNLQQDDLITAVDGKEVEMAADAVNIIKNREIGDVVEITVIRDEKELAFDLETLELEGNEGNPSIGVLIRSRGLDYNIPGEVNFDTNNIIGPSAGSVFSMEIYNQLIPEDITGGQRIAGTGTISLDGEIGRIDGVKYKIMAAKEAGVDLFIVPAENYETASQFAGDLELLRAETINDIIEHLENGLQS